MSEGRYFKLRPGDNKIRVLPPKDWVARSLPGFSGCPLCPSDYETYLYLPVWDYRDGAIKYWKVKYAFWWKTLMSIGFFDRVEEAYSQGAD